jgi:outer membrane protein TolC
MMKISLIVIALFLSYTAKGQEEKNKLKKKDIEEAKEMMIQERDAFLFPAELVDSSNISIADKLVLIALKNDPSMEVSSNNERIAKINMNKAKWDWLNMVSITGNINEFTVNPDAAGDVTGNNLFYPRYNFSVRIPLGVFGGNSAEVKMNRLALENTKTSARERKIAIRQEVLTLYENYKLYEVLIGLQNEKTEDAYSYYKSVEQDFANQSVDILAFKEASFAYNEELEKKHNMMYRQKATKITLESYLGMSLESAIEYNFEDQ